MIQRKELQAFFKTTLKWEGMPDPAVMDPEMANDLQVTGNDEIRKVGFAVSASLALFNKATSEHCDALVVHHGLHTPPSNATYTDPIYQRRLQYLQEHQLSLFGFHFLLDAHPILGNSVQLLSHIGVRATEPLGVNNDFLKWGMVGDIENPLSISEIVDHLRPLCSPAMVVYPFGPKRITRVACVTGSGTPGHDAFEEVLARGVHCYITGNPKESTREYARELGIHLIAGGHYHTEVFGVKALMKKLAENMDVETVFLDLPNEV